MDEPLYNRIVQALVSEIAAGDLLPDDRLMENRIATRFGVSRAPARKALAEMETKGLVTHAPPPARGFIVGQDAPQRAIGLAPETSEPFTTDTVPTWQRIYGEVEDALTRRIAFGSWRLTEAGIARQFGVSRTVAREVLARLQVRGLVVNEGKGWVAPELSGIRVRDLYELRALLEPAALGNVAARLSNRRLEAMIADLQTAMNAGADAGCSINSKRICISVFCRDARIRRCARR